MFPPPRSGTAEHFPLPDPQTASNGMRFSFSVIHDSGSELSFGEMKLLSTARALSCSGLVVILDEPLASLHGHRRKLIIDAIVRRKDAGNALLIIEHETHELDAMATAKYELLDGKIVERSLS